MNYFEKHKCFERFFKFKTFLNRFIQVSFIFLNVSIDIYLISLSNFWIFFVTRRKSFTTFSFLFLANFIHRVVQEDDSQKISKLGVHKITISSKISHVVKYGGESQSYRECWRKFALSTTRVSPNQGSNLRLDYRRMSISHLESAKMPTLTTPLRAKLPYENPPIKFHYWKQQTNL